VLRGAVLVDGSGRLCPKVAIENGEVQRVDAVRAVYAVETRAASYDLLGVEVSHVPMIGGLERGAEHKGNSRNCFRPLCSPSENQLRTAVLDLWPALPPGRLQD
jgi:hypothetical protein